MPRQKPKGLTEQRWVEDRRFRALIEHSPDGITLLDAEGRHLYVSPSIARILGYSGEELLGTNAFDLVYPDDLRPTRSLFDQAVGQPGSTAQVLIRFRHKNGTWRWVEIWARNLLDEPEIAAVVVNYRDVTERKQAEDALREGERRATGLLNAITEPILLTDLTGTILAANAATARGLGSTIDELLGKNVFDLLPPEVARVRKGCAERAIQTGEPLRYEDRRGEAIWDTQVYPILDAGGKVAALAVFAVDITERKWAEEALRESERQFRLALDGAQMGVWEVDLHTDTIRHSDRAARLFGLPARGFESSGADFSLMVHPDDRTDTVRRFRQAVAEGKEYEAEFRVIWPDGSQHWLHALGRVLRDPSGQPVRLGGVVRDITTRKQAEQALKQTEERYRLIVETAEEGIWLTDRKWRITFVNRRLTQMFGYTAEEMLGRHITEFMDEEERRAAPGHMRLREEGQRSTHDSKFRRKDGSVLWTIVAGNPLMDEEGRFTGTLALIADITERKKSEEKLRQSAEALEALSRRLLEVQETERQALARELHDEVGQSLTLLKLAVDRCRQVAPAEVPFRLEEAQAILGELVRRVRHMSLDLRPSMLDDLGLLPALLWQFDRYRAQTQIEVLFTQTGLEGRRLGTHVETAAFRMVQEALTNVARHAGVRHVSVHVGVEDDVLRVQVQDGGRGFDVEAALRADASVGLRGMFERARLLGGKLQINSDPGAGTFLTAEIPLRALATTPGAVCPGGPASPPEPPPG